MWACRPFCLSTTRHPHPHHSVAEHTPSGHRTRHKIIKQDTGDSINNSWKSAADWLDDLQCNSYKLICICSPSAAEKKKTIQSETTRVIIVNMEQIVKESVSLKPEGAKIPRVAQELPQSARQADSQVSTVFTCDHLFPLLLIYTLLNRCISEF